MIPEKSLVVYKNRPALAAGLEGEKINIAVYGGDTVKVREKDIEVIYPGPCSLKDLEESAPSANVREAWELLADEAAPQPDVPQADGIPLKELAELAYGVFSPRTAWAAWDLLREGLYFTGDARAVRARSRLAVEEDEKKREEKQRETGDRAAFLERLKKLPPLRQWTGQLGGEKNSPPELSEAERRFLLDVEALALGKTDKSRTLKELGRSETPQEAHRLLLASGTWTVWVNPHPGRFGFSRDSAKIVPPPPEQEERLDLTGLAAYAIDSPWSDDPDDAVSLEASGPDAYTLWVHVADPAASVFPGSPADTEARGRGVTLYLPEGASRMLSTEAMSLFTLGGSHGTPAGQEVSPALSFKIKIRADLTIEETEVFPSLVRVTRLTYAEADALIAAGTDATLAALASLAERNVERRLDTGAVMIGLPEVHISVSPGATPAENRISIEPIASYRSAEMVRECMIWAGEGAARWALQKRLPFPYIGQDAGELPERRLPGLAGAWQLRRCMRSRSLSAKPAVHWGLGLDAYTQVTSPLRRYTDLLCHQQIRALLGRDAGRGGEPLGEEEILLRVSTAEAAASAASRAERASRLHWTTVYLSDKKDSVWEGVVLDRKGNRGTVIIPALGLESQVSLRGTEGPNDEVKLSLLSVRIPEGELGFALA